MRELALGDRTALTRLGERTMRYTLGLIAATMIALAGCGVDRVTDPRFEPEIVNSVDNFEFQSTGMEDRTETLQYVWQNTGTTATAYWSTSLTGGSGLLTVLDATGAELFSAPLTTESAGSTNAGTAGAWTIRVLLTNASGTINLSVQKGVGQQPGSWLSLAPVPSLPGATMGVEGMSVASVGNVIVAAMGFDRNSSDTKTTRLYDIASDTWSFGADVPLGGFIGSSEGAGISHDGIFYSIGGRGGVEHKILAYDRVTDTWNTGLADMSTNRTGLAVARVGTYLYAIGGRTASGAPCSGSETSSVERYNVLTDTWETVAPLPSARSDLAAATVGNKIYVFGGCTTSPFTVLSDVDMYDPNTDTWSTAPTDMPTARAAMYAVAMRGGTVYVIGGWDGIGSGLQTNEAYKAATDTWTTGLPPMPTGRAETGAADHNGKIYILGGAKPAFGNSTDVNEVFKP